MMLRDTAAGAGRRPLVYFGTLCARALARATSTGWIRFAVVLHRREFFILRLLLVRSLVYLAWACTAWHASAT